MRLFEKGTERELTYGSKVRTQFGRTGTLLRFDQKTHRCTVKFDDEVHPSPGGYYIMAINAELRP